MVNPVLLDINGGINAVCSGPSDRRHCSLIQIGMSSMEQTRLEETLDTMTPPLMNKREKGKFFVKTLEKGKTLLTYALIRS